METINFTDSLMRTLFTLFILLTFLGGCASVEPTTEQETDEGTAVEEAGAVAPDWFDPLVSSATDSVLVYGFALASAVDSSEAVTLAENAALNNLRYEIDYLAENARVELAEDQNIEAYSEASFIIKLRNLVQNLSLSDANLEFDTERSGNEIYHVYAQASLSKNSLWDLISKGLNDSEFLNIMESSSAE